jgi:predicted KAP-like P-loop ATPase
MADHFNDSPIEGPEDDQYGISSFAESIAKSMLNIREPSGTTIALHGPWGSGKSSAVNLVRAALAASTDTKLVVTDFKCWWYRGEEALALAFLQNLNTVLKDGLGDKIKDLIPSLTQRMLQAGPVIGQAVSLASGVPLAGLFSRASKFASTFFPAGDTVEKIFRKLSKILAEQNRRFLVIIDDIDRLTPEEAIAVFRLVKSVGRLPNLIYLLVFDRDLAEKAVAERYPSEGPHFLEKIIQASFELPAPIQTDLNGAVLTAVEEICGAPPDDDFVRFMNLFFDAVVPYIQTPRHVVRFKNAISVTWPAIAGEISRADFVALETLRLYEPSLFRAIRQRKDQVCGTRQEGDPDQRNDKRFEVFNQDVPEERKQVAKLALQRLFPRLEQMGYGTDWVATWDVERRVCVHSHFDTYFRLSLSDEALSSAKIDELVARVDDEDFIATTFRDAALIQRKNGQSMVPVYFDELNTHAARINKSKVLSLISTLFKIQDEISLQKDAERGMLRFADTDLRLHWLIRRLTKDRFSIDERTTLYQAALKNASLGWLVDFVASATANYHREGGPRREDECLVAESAIDALQKSAVESIRKAAKDGTLLRHPKMVAILYRWRDFLDNDPTEVRAWADRVLRNDEAVVLFAKAMTGESHSAGMGGFGSLGDRVSRSSKTAMLDDNVDIIDQDSFRKNLKRVLNEPTTDPAAGEVVRTFLNAWDRQKKRVRKDES